LNFVHELANQIDTASVVSMQVFISPGVGQEIWTETRSGIGHDNDDSALGIGLHPAPDLFRGVIPTTVHNRIGQGLLQCQPHLKALLFGDV